MQHTKWNLDHKTVLPISLRPKYIENRDEKGHLEIDSIIGKSLLSIKDNKNIKDNLDELNKVVTNNKQNLTKNELDKKIK